MNWDCRRLLVKELEGSVSFNLGVSGLQVLDVGSAVRVWGQVWFTLGSVWVREQEKQIPEIPKIRKVSISVLQRLELSFKTTKLMFLKQLSLSPLLSYEFKVKPKNELGEGPLSEPVSFNTESGQFLPSSELNPCSSCQTDSCLRTAAAT